MMADMRKVTGLLLIYLNISKLYIIVFQLQLQVVLQKAQVALNHAHFPGSHGNE